MNEISIESAKSQSPQDIRFAGFFFSVITALRFYWLYAITTAPKRAADHELL